MKKLTKLVVFMLLTAVFAVFLASCHGMKDYEAFELPGEFDTDKKYEIVFWAKNEKNIRQTTVYRKIISDFEKLYPNIDVTMKIYSDYKMIYNDVITNIPTQTTPNVCISYPDHIATYMTGENIVVPLYEILYDEKFGLGGSEIAFDAPKPDEVVPKFLEEGKIGGVQYALPFMRSTEALYYNKSYIEALGYDIPDVITWEFVWKVSNAALEKNDDGTYKLNGGKKMIPFVYKSTDNMMIQMLRQFGGEYSNEDGDILMFNDTTKDILYTIAENTDTGAFSTFAEVSYPADLLNRGQCIFAIDSTAGSVWMGREGPLSTVELEDAIEFELGVSEIPQKSEDSSPAMISQGPSICLFNKEDPGEVMASWIFIQYLLSNDAQVAYSQTEGYVPVTTKAQQSDEYLDYLSRAGELDEEGDNYLYYAPKIAVSKLLLDNIENTFVTPVFNGSASLRMAAGEMIDQVVGAVLSKPKKTVDDAFIEALYGKVVSRYHLDIIYMGRDETSGTPLPETAVLLLSAVVLAWVGIGSYLLYGYVEKRKNKNSNLLDKR